MVIETLDPGPPALFRQGTSALAKLAFFSALALFLMVADTRFTLAQHAAPGARHRAEPGRAHAARAGRRLAQRPRTT